MTNMLGDVAKAIKLGAMGPGDLSPCPICKVARHQRSVYIRCNRCALNWEAGEDISKHPRASRVAVVVARDREASE